MFDGNTLCLVASDELLVLVVVSGDCEMVAKIP